jgi:hypothetical protein
MSSPEQMKRALLWSCSVTPAFCPRAISPERNVGHVTMWRACGGGWTLGAPPSPMFTAHRGIERPQLEAR